MSEARIEALSLELERLGKQASKIMRRAADSDTAGWEAIRLNKFMEENQAQQSRIQDHLCEQGRN